MAVIDEHPNADFGIEIAFVLGSEAPARVFRAMAGLVESLEALDRVLGNAIAVEVKPALLLDDVEVGSIRTWISQLVRSVDDEVIKDPSVKKLIGSYLVKCKYRLLSFLDGKPTISSKAEMDDLRDRLHDAAAEVPVPALRVRKPIDLLQLGEVLASISQAGTRLQDEDSARFLSRFGEVNINLRLRLTPEGIEELLTVHTLEQRDELMLQVKKPDYLGDSMWEFRYGGRVIEAKIRDEEWLRKFQNREVDVRPGDALACVANILVRIGEDGKAISTHYDILHVLNVIRSIPPDQMNLLHG